MFAGWGSWVARFRWPVLTVALVAVVSSGIWGLGVFGQLTEGGYNDPNSESSHAAVIVQQALGTPAADVVAIYTPAKTKIDDPALTKRIKARLAALPTSAVKSNSSYWQQKSAQYAAKDKSSAVAVITLVGPDDAAKIDQFRAIKDDFAVDGASVQLAGGVPLNDASSTRSTSDLGTAELISLPITLVLLLFIFGSLVAAALPVLVGGMAVLGSLGILHAVASHTEVNSFAVNVASLLGLGMAIDYGLFMVGRFREEQAEGRTPAEAVRRTVGTAGRTVLFSATLLMIALSGLLLFPQGFLNSLAYGGLSAVALAAFLSLTLLPALLAVLGPRVDKLPIRLPRRAAAQPAGSIWARVAGFVLRHRVLVAVPIVAILLLLASPMFGVHFGDSDERILPADDPARVAVETLKASYPQFANNGIQIVLQGTGNTAAFAAAARAVPGVDQLGPVTKTAQGAIMTATLTSSDPYSVAARDAVDGIRDLPVPAGAQLLVGGTTARNLDSLHATAAELPLMVALLAGATLVLMFLAFGSILLPIKAVAMSVLSLSATFGVLVWIFDQGHLSGLLNITPAPLEVGIVVLMAAVVFGLSTDYEVFLLSRMVEARTRGATSNEAITTGLARTGRVISAAAVLLIVVTGAFALSAVTTMRFVGVGMIIALLLDATVVRMLLVPAVLGLLGDAAWWAPGPLRRLQQRAALSEYAAETAPAGKHAAPDDTVVLAGVVAPRRELRSKSPVPELLYRDEDRPDWARPSEAMTELSLIALPATADSTVVFPVFADDAPGLSSTVRIELEPAASADESAETVDAELVEEPPGAEDLEATGILVLAPADGEEIADAEVVAEPGANARDENAEEPDEPVVAEPLAEEPVATDKPVAAYEPPATPEPDIAYAPDATHEPDVTYEPAAAPEPDIAYEPDATHEPDVAYEPDVTHEPDAYQPTAYEPTAYEPEGEHGPLVGEPAAVGEPLVDAGTLVEPVDMAGAVEGVDSAGTVEGVDSAGAVDGVGERTAVGSADAGDLVDEAPAAGMSEFGAGVGQAPAAENAGTVARLDTSAAGDGADDELARAGSEPIAETPLVVGSWAAEAAAGDGDVAYRMRADGDAEPAPDREAQVGAGPIEADAQPGGEPEPHADARPEPQADTQPEAAPEPHADAWPEPQANAQPEAAPGPQADAWPELQAVTKPEAAPEPHADARPEPQADTKPEAAPEPRADAEPELQADAEPDAEPDQAKTDAAKKDVRPSDTPLFAGTGADSYAALFPELFAPEPEPEPPAKRYDDWSAPVSEDAFFAPLAPDPVLYRREEPSADERYVTHTPADETAEEQPDRALAPTADLSDRYADLRFDGPSRSMFEPVPSPEPASPESASFESSAPEPALFQPSAPESASFQSSAPEPSLFQPSAPAPASLQPSAAEPSFEPSVSEPAFAAAEPEPTFAAPVPEPIFEAPEPPFEPRFPSFERRVPEPSFDTRAPEPSFGTRAPEPSFDTRAPEPAFEPRVPRPRIPEPAFETRVPEPVADATPRRPADLSDVAAAWRKVIENRPPVTERPADLAGYVGQTPRRTTPAPEPERGDRPTDLGSYSATRPADLGEVTGGWRPAIGGREARPADLGQYGQTWQPAESWRPETLGDQPPAAPVRRPASLADTVPKPRRPRDDAPGDGPTRDLSGYGEQEETHPRA